MTITAAAYQSRQTEAQFQAAVVHLAETLGWDVFHFPNAVINPAGWVDLLMLRNGVWLLRELKTERGRLGHRQLAMLERLRANGANVALWTPSSWPEIERTLGEPVSTRRDAAPH